MKLILISPPGSIPGELSLLQRLWELSPFTYHLRKPEWSKDEISHYLGQLPNEYLKHVMVHHQPALVSELGLKGAHYKPEITAQVPADALTSAPVHGFEEILALEGNRDYALLSPIFDSISKKGHTSRFSLAECSAFFKHYKGTLEVFALGGIDLGKIKAASMAGFHGAAVMGAIWRTLIQEGEASALARFTAMLDEAKSCGERPYPKHVRLS